MCLIILLQSKIDLVLFVFFEGLAVRVPADCSAVSSSDQIRYVVGRVVVVLPAKLYHFSHVFWHPISIGALNSGNRIDIYNCIISDSIVLVSIVLLYFRVLNLRKLADSR